MSDCNTRTERSEANVALIELIEDTEHQLSMARAALGLPKLTKSRRRKGRKSK